MPRHPMPAPASRPCRAPAPAPRAPPASRALLSPRAASPVPAGAARAGALLLGSAVKVQSCLASLPGAQAGWAGAQCWAARSLPVCFPRIRQPCSASPGGFALAGVSFPSRREGGGRWHGGGRDAGGARPGQRRGAEQWGATTAASAPFPAPSRCTGFVSHPEPSALMWHLEGLALARGQLVTINPS